MCTEEGSIQCGTWKNLQPLKFPQCLNFDEKEGPWYTQGVRGVCDEGNYFGKGDVNGVENELWREGVSIGLGWLFP